MNISISNPDFIKRMIVDSENLSEYRNKFMRGEKMTDSEIKKIIETKPFHKNINWGPDSISMVPWSGLEHVDKCLRNVIKNNIEGDFVETGVWRGGSCIVAKAVINDMKSNKKVFVADSFEGLPAPDKNKYPDDANDQHYLDDNLRVSLEGVKNNFRKFNLLDNNVIFLKGWFKDTIPNAPIDKISVLRLDGDMYESTIDVLQNLYTKLSINGYCIIDDYGHPACIEAVNDFRRAYNISEPIIKVDPDKRTEVYYWVKKNQIQIKKNINYPKRGVKRFLYISKNNIKNHSRNTINKAKSIVKKMIGR